MKTLSSWPIFERVRSFAWALRAKAARIRPGRSSTPGNSAAGHCKRDLVAWEMALPGLRPKDIRVRACGNTITIEAQRFPTREEKRMNCIWRETNYWSLTTSVSLPSPVDPKTLTATYMNGVLRIEGVRHPWARVRKVPIHCPPPVIETAA